MLDITKTQIYWQLKRKFRKYNIRKGSPSQYGQDQVAYELLKKPENGTFVDIGANVGWFSKLAADNFIDCQIFSYELDTENYQNATNLLNQYKNVKLFNTAVIGKHRFNKYWKHSSNIGGHKPIFQGSES
mgnify:CR=1 FL=1